MSSRLERELEADELAPGAALVPFEYDMFASCEVVRHVYEMDG